METQSALERFAALAKVRDDEIDLGLGALLIAASEYPDMDIEREAALLDGLASAVEPRIEDGTDALRTLNTLSRFLFDDLGFRGNDDDYYDPRNSFLNDVLKRRLGIPITLALVYLEVGRRVGAPLLGIGMPGHFLVRHRDETDVYVDAFHGGILLSQEECADRFRKRTRMAFLSEEHLAPVGGREFLGRMLRNLKHIYLERGDGLRAIRTVTWLHALEPERTEELRDRGLLYYRLGRYEEARDDLNVYLESGPTGNKAAAVRRVLRAIEKGAAK